MSVYSTRRPVPLLHNHELAESIGVFVHFHASYPKTGSVFGLDSGFFITISIRVKPFKKEEIIIP
jgi:hypothetical protein